MTGNSQVIKLVWVLCRIQNQVCTLHYSHQLMAVGNHPHICVARVTEGGGGPRHTWSRQCIENVTTVGSLSKMAACTA
jgi:hypothetical protein